MPNSTSLTGVIYKNGSRFLHNTGTSNTFLGVTSGNFTLTGNGRNTGIGVSTLTALTNGEDNVAVGVSAGSGLSSGSRNVCIGETSGTTLTTGSNNVIIGSEASSVNGITTGTNNIYIGYQTGNNDGNISNRIFIGNTSHTSCFLEGVRAVPSGTGTEPLRWNPVTGELVYNSSSREYKTNIESLDADYVERLSTLRPVTFNPKDDLDDLVFGLIHEEVIETYPELTFETPRGIKGVKYDIIPLLVLAAYQKLKKEHDALKEEVALLKQLVMKLAKR